MQLIFIPFFNVLLQSFLDVELNTRFGLQTLFRKINITNEIIGANIIKRSREKNTKKSSQFKEIERNVKKHLHIIIKTD